MMVNRRVLFINDVLRIEASSGSSKFSQKNSFLDNHLKGF
jgi:hypothetical protein